MWIKNILIVVIVIQYNILNILLHFSKIVQLILYFIRVLLMNE